MKLTKAKLRQLIKEELEVFREGQLWSDDRPAGNDPNFKIIPQEAWIRAALDSGFGYELGNLGMGVRLLSPPWYLPSHTTYLSMWEILL